MAINFKKAVVVKKDEKKKEIETKNDSLNQQEIIEELKEELEEYKSAFNFLKEKLRVEVPQHPLDAVDLEFLLIVLNKLTFEGKDVQQVFQTTLKLQEEFKKVKALKEEG
tara:strand:+ start:331 stop:660 length:330 start_codon:yes stop_codon:yes gene_type:complete